MQPGRVIVWTRVLEGVLVGSLQDQVLQMKKDLPQALLMLGGGGNGRNYGVTVSNFIMFGYEGNSIFKDVRLRQAMSMAIDREDIISVMEGLMARIFSEAVERINLMQPAFVISVGDLIEGYSRDKGRVASEWKEFQSYVTVAGVLVFKEK